MGRSDSERLPETPPGHDDYIVALSVLTFLMKIHQHFSFQKVFSLLLALPPPLPPLPSLLLALPPPLPPLPSLLLSLTVITFRIHLKYTEIIVDLLFQILTICIYACRRSYYDSGGPPWLDKKRRWQQAPTIIKRHDHGLATVTNNLNKSTKSIGGYTLSQPAPQILIFHLILYQWVPDSVDSAGIRDEFSR